MFKEATHNAPVTKVKEAHVPKDHCEDQKEHVMHKASHSRITLRQEMGLVITEARTGITEKL
jgi:hypothetical protein